MQADIPAADKAADMYSDRAADTAESGEPPDTEVADTADIQAVREQADIRAARAQTDIRVEWVPFQWVFRIWCRKTMNC